MTFKKLFIKVLLCSALIYALLVCRVVLKAGIKTFKLRNSIAEQAKSSTRLLCGEMDYDAVLMWSEYVFSQYDSIEDENPSTIYKIVYQGTAQYEKYVVPWLSDITPEYIGISKDMIHVKVTENARCGFYVYAEDTQHLADAYKINDKLWLYGVDCN